MLTRAKLWVLRADVRTSIPSNVLGLRLLVNTEDLVGHIQQLHLTDIANVLQGVDLI